MCVVHLECYFISSVMQLSYSLYYYIAVIDAFNWLAIFQKEIHSMRDRESLLKSQLTIFGINYPDSQELAQLDKVNVTRIYTIFHAFPRAYSTSRRFSTCEGCSSDRIGVAIDERME